MAHSPRLTNTLVNTMADAGAALFDNGYIRIYDAPQPTNGGDAITTQTLLAELRWNATAFPAASGGVLTPNAITADSSANNSGTAAWFRALKSDGTTTLFDGSIGTANADLIMASTTITAGQNVSVTGGNIAVPKS